MRLRAALESAPSGILMTDRDGRIVLVNREIERMFGYSREDLLGKSVDTLVPTRFRGHHGDFRAGFLNNPRARAMGTGRDLFGVRKDGTEVPVEIGLTPVVTDEGSFVISSIVDITARREAEAERTVLEQQLREAQKHEALGTLAGGIAHDFNNLLAAIVGYAELTLKVVTDSAPRHDLEKLLEVAARARGVVERILSFSRRTEAHPKTLDLGRTVVASEELLRSALPANIRVAVNRPVAPVWVSADETSLHQVVMNLATNSAQAMPTGGAIEIGIDPIFVHDHIAREKPYLREGRYAVLKVRDTGGGIPDEIRDRVFEPFFTTKAPGQGTGLGLAIVRSIVSAHQGAIEMDSELGRGTEFRCYFPAVETELVIPPAPETLMATGMGERILYVDDEPALREVTVRQLKLLDYTPSKAASPEEALALFRGDPTGYDLIVTDYSMPGMSGLELAAEIHRIRPDVPILMFTGYMEDLEPTELEAAGVRMVLRKPVALAQLEAGLAEIFRPTH
ncbi:MAG: PAS domain S-box protein [Gemmatimonadetes bacterium]|nr:PAS domain S-box protein [Gemmatimonadota bacterium]